ncbi:MAG: substrate-binding domain-containing protein [Pseudomonadota bacterium]
MSETVKIVVPVALKEIFEIIAPSFTSATGHGFESAIMLNPEVPAHIAGGADWSIALSNPVYIDQIVAAGDCDGGTRMLGSAPLAFAVRGHEDAPALRDPHLIASFLRDAESIGITELGTSGAQFARLAEGLGISREMLGKLRLLPGGGPMKALLAGEVDVAGLPLSNIAPVEGVTPRAICPLELGVHIDLAFCVRAGANTATRSFGAWITSADVVERMRPLGVLKDA